MTQSLDFYFDFASPFGFLASRKIGALADTIGREINWKPFLLGAVYKEHSGAPLSHPLKKNYVFKDFFRRAQLDGIEGAQLPLNFPGSSVPSSRLAYWVEREAPEKMGAYVEAAFATYWLGGKDMADIHALLDVAESLGLDRNAAIAGAQEQGIKDRLRSETDAALRRGVFGSPTFMIDNEPFWGEDRIGDIERLYGHG